MINAGDAKLGETVIENRGNGLLGMEVTTAHFWQKEKHSKNIPF